MEIMYVDLKKCSEEELVDAINNNNKFISHLERELKILKQVPTNLDCKPEKSKEDKVLMVNPLIPSPSKNNSETNDIDETIDYYFEMIDGLDGEDNDKLIADINEALPSKNSQNHDQIFFNIQLRLLKNVKEIREFIEEEIDEINKDDLEDLKQELNLNIAKIQAINSIKNKTANIDEVEDKRNNLIFVPTSGGNIRILDELSSIDGEYLEGFRGLINSIKDGSFKNVKRFHTTNSKTAYVSEVKDYKIRVVFDRIGPHEYALITAFIKKSDNDIGYLRTLSSKIRNYMNIKDSLTESLSNPSFLALQQQYEEKLDSIFESRSRQVQYVKKSGDK